MTTSAQPSLRVHIQELPAREVVCLTCQLDQASGQFSTQIAEGFGQVKRWLEHQDQAVADRLIIGLPHVVERQLIGYDCCVEPAHIATPLPQGWQTKHLPGGRYAVLSLEKDSATIGERIGQFFAEYVPQHQLILDPTRPSYEVYYAQTMDYCIPIEEVDGLLRGGRAAKCRRSYCSEVASSTTRAFCGVLLAAPQPGASRPCSKEMPDFTTHRTTGRHERRSGTTDPNVEPVFFSPEIPVELF
jgi:DNA gyrase inhibitor GyrI